MTTLHLSAIIRKEDSVFVSWCPELDICSQGNTIDRAIANLKEAVDFYLEDEDAHIPEDLLMNTKNCDQSPVLMCLNVKKLKVIQ